MNNTSTASITVKHYILAAS